MSRATKPYVLFPLGALVVMGVIWGTTFYLINVQNSAARHTAATSARELLGTYEAQVVRALREIDQTLKTVAFAAETQGHYPLVLARLQKRSLLPSNLVFEVSLVDAQGGIRASTGPLQSGNVSDQGYFVALRDPSTAATQGLWVDRARLDPESAEWRLRFARRLVTQDGKFGGVAILTVDAAYFVSGYEVAKLGERGVLGVLGTDGRFRVRRTGDVVSADDAVDYPSVVSPDTGDADAPATLLANAWDRVRRYTSTRQLYDFPLAVVVGLSEQEQLGAASNDRRLYLERAAGASLVVLLLAGILGRLSWKLLQSQRRESAAEIANARQLEFVAYHDGLSGLPNRSLFTKLLTQAIKAAHRQGRHLAVLFLDLDRFKQINDTLGHDAGDLLLQETARRLLSCLRESDTVARLGGDEFVVLLPELESGGYAAVVAQKLLTTLAQPFLMMGQEFRVTASVGICTYPEDGEDEQALTKHADVAMYQAKLGGTNNYQFYSEKLNANSLERLTLESSLRHALEKQEFVLDYQPKQDVASGRITGVEALLRWQHPDLGTVAPLRFMAVAEETGLIVPIGKWVLRTACAQNVAWQRQGLPELNVSVNLSSRQFSDEHLLQDVAAILHETGMQATFLELEILESELFRNVEQTLHVMAGLKAAGIKIAVDSFGTFYSSMSTLGQFPIDTIKIDRSLIRDVASSPDTTPEKRTLASAIIEMGRRLSLVVVAEGVETKDQADFLRLHSCDEVQGFYFSKPLRAEQVTKLLQGQKPPTAISA